MAKKRKKNSGIPIQPGFKGRAIITYINPACYNYAPTQALQVGDVVTVASAFLGSSGVCAMIIPTWNQYNASKEAYKYIGCNNYRVNGSGGWCFPFNEMKLNKVRF